MRDTKDRLTEADLKGILSGMPNVPVYIETGVWYGCQLAIATCVFPNVYGIELNAHYADLAQKNVPSAKVFHGPTEEWLPVMLDMNPNVPMCLYLDAHYCKLDPPIEFSEFPLWKELAIIKEKACRPSVVIVDDVHTFGKKRDDIRTPEWESVTAESITKFLDVSGPEPTWEIIKDCYVTWL